MKKFLFTIIAIILYQIVPLLGASELIFHWKSLVMIFMAAVLWLSQPSVVSSNFDTDKNTLWVILGMAGVSTIVPELDWAYRLQNQDGVRLWNSIGLTLMFGGLLFRVWAIYTLGKNFTSTVQTSNEQNLVQTGVYTKLRHPSYLGAFVAIVGCSVLLQSWVGFVVAFAAMSFAYYKRISVEERALQSH